jgi:hypothetical protein
LYHHTHHIVCINFEYIRDFSASYIKAA